MSVVLYHYFTRFDELYGSQASNIITNNLYLGVHLFFIISGYLIYRSSINRSTINFAINRFIRLYPTYWVCVTITFLLVGFLGLPGREVSFNEFVLNLLMFHHLIQVPDVDGVYWTLQVELFFYFIIAVLLMVGSLKYLYVTLFAVSLVTISMKFNFFDSNGVLNILTLHGYASLFLLGVGSEYSQRYRSIFPVLFPMLLIFFTFKISESIFVFVIFFLFQYSLLSRVSTPRNVMVSVFSFFGKISYPLYLLHQNIGYSLIIHLSTYVSIYVSIIITLILVCLLSYIVHNLVEVKVTNFIKCRVYRRC